MSLDVEPAFEIPEETRGVTGAGGRAVSGPISGSISGEEKLARDLLAQAGISINGNQPWDMQVHDPRLYARVIAEGTIGLGEGYMERQWDCRQLDEFFNRVVAAELWRKLPFSLGTALLYLRAKYRNQQTKRRSLETVETFYDLPVELFEASFDKRLTGSCGYWKDAKNLDEAQEAKQELVCRKIGLASSHRVLDIGCGWGSFMGYAAEKYRARCTGMTISGMQVEYARKRYAGLPLEFRHEDYRDFKPREKFDRVVSMGMFEHVGSKNYRRYFELARAAMKEDGLFLLHTIWQNERSPAIDPWLDKYIYPNGQLPSVGEISSAVEGLFVVEDVHNFGADYDRTLVEWDRKFQANKESVRAPIEKSGRSFEKFCRLWEYYHLSCAGGFRSRIINVGQFVLSPKGVRGGYRTVR